jgi:hypothetical protein
VRLDVTIDEFHSLSIHRDGAGAEDQAVGDDGLGIDSWQRLGGLVGEDWGFGRGGHCCCEFDGGSVNGATLSKDFEDSDEWKLNERKELMSAIGEHSDSRSC